MTAQLTIYLAFGPVQEFLAQARRTRDLSAGSYLLSFLAARSLAAATGAGGTVAMPSLDGNPLWQAVNHGWDTLSGEQQDLAARVGSVPHIAELTVVDEAQGRAVAEAAVSGWNAAWQQVAAAVRDYLGREVLRSWDSATDATWRRQIGETWTATWSITNEREAAGRRKSLRSFALQPEPGEKCTCCGSRQALHTGPEDGRAAVRASWNEASNQAGHVEVRKEGSERLCAVCAVKRFYPHVAKAALGWAVPRSFPSTSAFAGFAWRRQVLETGATNPALRAAVATTVAALAQEGARQSDDSTSFSTLQHLARGWGAEQQTASAFLRYDGDWFNPDTINAAREAAAQFTKEEHRERRARLARSARGLLRATGAAGIAPPGTDYALLVMDGDKMGNLLRDHPARRSSISKALGDFSAGVRHIVETKHDGRLIYAGGDDVLAMLPKECALPAAQALQQAYVQAFAEDIPATISAGLLFAHEQTPLRTVLAEGHELLEHTAKERGGRDAIAISVRQRGGASLTFAAKWDSAAVTTIEEVAKNARQGDYSRGFLYDLERLLPVVDQLADPNAGCELLAADYLQGERRKKQGAGLELARERAGTLLRLQPVTGAGTRWDVIRLALWLAGPRQEER